MNDKVSTSVSILTGGYALANLEQTLSIIILVLSIINIIWNLGCKIYTHIKNKQYDKIDDDISDAIGDFNELNDKNKEEKQ